MPIETMAIKPNSVSTNLNMESIFENFDSCFKGSVVQDIFGFFDKFLHVGKEEK